MGLRMEALPDEIWMKILEIGTENSNLNHTDLSSLSICCRHFNKLTKEDPLWSTLLTLDFPPNPSSSSQSLLQSSSSSSKKTLYKYTLERQIRHELAYNRRRVVELEYQLGVFSRKIKRFRRELKVIDEQMEENSGELLNIIKHRYVACHWELANVKKKHMHMEKDIASTRAKIIDKDASLHAFYVVGKDTNVLVDDPGVGSMARDL